MAKNEVKWGAFLSYILIILNAIYGLFLTPYILAQIGEASYGVYKTISAFTSSLLVLDLGLGGTVMRYIAKYRADKEESKISNYIAMCLIQTSVISAIVCVVIVVLYQFLDVIYSNGLTSFEILKAKELYIILGIGIIAHIFENFLNGIIAGYNRFVFANGIKVLLLIIRIFALVVFLGIFKDSLVIAFVDVGVTFVFIISELFFILFRLRVKIKYAYWDNKVFWESFVYTMLMFLTSMVVQINTNFSNVAIGAILSSSAVTIYSMATLIFSMYQQMSTAISGVMLPTITNSLKNDDEKYSKTIAIVRETGRIQFVILGAVFAGFVVLGRSFIQLWLGDGFKDVYILVLILLVPALLELCINVCLSILRAKNMLGFRTIVITASAAMNFIITLLLTKHIGYFASAIGTMLSILLGSVIVMCIYYRKKLGIHMIKLYGNIFKGIWVCIVLSGLASFAVTLLIDSIILKFVIGFVIFVIVYAATLLIFGLNKEEKDTILQVTRRLKKW